MKTIILVRHASAVRGDSARDDFARPLDRRGEGDALALTEQFEKSGLRVDALVSSPAVRARSTAEVLAQKLSVPVQVDERIYKDEVQSLLETVRSFDDRHRVIVMVGHNPALSGFLRYLTEDNYADLPTAAAAVINLPINIWRHTFAGQGAFKGILSASEDVLKIHQGPALSWSERYRIWQFEHSKQIYLTIIFALALTLILGIAGLVLYKSTDPAGMPQQGSSR